METSKTKKLPFFFLTVVLAIASFVQMVEVAEADAPSCDILLHLCSGSCWKSGHCEECCKHYGFLDGRCSLKHGDGCYCCGSAGATAAGQADFLA
ncbi:hypothetical protein BAE44_0018448 [Dichanthelium oligosanthes]|uniref:Knottin scorpion toxin-like domain-containing protein n=1 Tax=Dichanthelium oligosanthes TaxID=888268 RepID=A0A1E5V6B7_9POAL|nr:hypothetical protein BAE44_0018448 [Dichanthelium oligosanthes]